MYKLIFYVPVSNLTVVKDSVFSTGAGSIGSYSNCSWEVRGTGQFKPLTGSNPHLGKIDEIELVDEYRVEILCTGENIEDAVRALKLAHPYEEPAYEVYEVLNF